MNTLVVNFLAKHILLHIPLKCTPEKKMLHVVRSYNHSDESVPGEIPYLQHHGCFNSNSCRDAARSRSP
jgi:hypothetical protein